MSISFMFTFILMGLISTLWLVSYIYEGPKRIRRDIARGWVHEAMNIAHNPIFVFTDVINPKHNDSFKELMERKNLHYGRHYLDIVVCCKKRLFQKKARLYRMRLLTAVYDEYILLNRNDRLSQLTFLSLCLEKYGFYGETVIDWELLIAHTDPTQQIENLANKNS